MHRSLYVGCLFACLAAVCCLNGMAFAQARAPFADAAYMPPAPLKSTPPLPLDDLENGLGGRRMFHIFQNFEGATKALQAGAPARKGEPLKGGEIVETGLAGADLLGSPVLDSNGIAVYAASVISVDAEGIKLRLDVSGLRPGEEAWAIDPVSLTPFGPYVATAGGQAEVWAAMVLGDEAVLLVKSPYEETPNLELISYSHIFRSLRDVAKNLACNIDIACETEPATLAASSGIGFVIIEGVGFCSGTLINNPLTPPPEFEPLFITANHCICSQDETLDTEVIWDFRTAECGGTPPTNYHSLPLRSYGQKLLATNNPLDSTLILLNGVSAGPYGRAYLGWDARLLNVGEAIKCIHHPDLTRMRISKGTVRTVSDDENGRENQTIVHWDEGVTERGSSGSCLLLDNPAENNRIVGTLSQGTDHDCANNENNIDWYSSFREFYPEIQAYINQNPPSTAQGDDGCGAIDTGCALSRAYAGAPAALQSLRAVRDHVLMPFPGGSRAVAAYYKATPAVAPVVAASPAARGAVIAASAPFVRLGAFVKLLSD